MTTRRFALEAGPVWLDIALEGAPGPETRRIWESRCKAFIAETPCHDRVVTCRWTIGDDGWVAYDDPRGAREPVAERSGDGWRSRWCYYDLRFSADASDGVFADRRAGLEHALRGAAVYATQPREALWFHAATLVWDERAYLFAGRPNAGKSTLAREGGADRVLTDEISIVVRRDDGWWALPSPFWGTGRDAQRGAPAPLAAIVVLDQAPDANVWQSIDGAAAVGALIPHLGAQAAAQLADPAVLQALATLVAVRPVASLHWHRGSPPLSGAPWKRSK